MNLTGVKKIEQMGYSRASLFPVSMGIEGASKEKIHIIGGILLEVSATNPDTLTTVSTIQLFYVSTQLTQTFLSRDCCDQLQTLPANFPSIGSFPPAAIGSATVSGPSSTIPACINTGVPTQADQPCQCPRRTLPPTDQVKLPCEPTEENLPILKQFILDRYSSSAFNICEHQSLPLMSGSEPL